ncbi:hypothetical protein G7Y89_g6343 [Cudoniella acicularis]|uniref:Uncharacterized protein n=1 Tax=Cudoniella acicularis TaxID=354080 RepID=A0A8H4RM44_9HELO|nr:hypothetical protein G7Y89_g6343 [Cudoniella acicularis]
MATEPSLTTDNVEIFKQLEKYSWDKDKEFQGGLSAILGPNPSPSQIEDLTLRAQCFYLSRKRSIPINFDDYKAYLQNKSSSTLPNHEQEPQQISSTSPLLPPPNPSSEPASEPIPEPASDLQPNHPHHEADPQLNHPYREADFPPATMSVGSTSAPQAEKQAPYPPTFAEIIELITSGAPIPGIMEIPDTVLTSQATAPKATKRRKPWEKDIPEEIIINGTGEGTFGDVRRDEVIVQELPEESK